MINTIAPVAEYRKSELRIADEEKISEKDLADFSYLEHHQNVAVAIDVCSAAGVKADIALAGMQKVKPDLGALVVNKLDFGNGSILFVNSMAANDPVSTLKIWNFVERRYLLEGYTCIYLNCREDRRSRTRQLLQLIYEDIKPDRSIIRGQKVDAMVKHIKYHSPQTHTDILQDTKPMGSSIDLFKKLPADSLLFAIGNQVGFGQDLIEKLMEFKADG
jgi:poly-gamma-glutamate synthase PgsB/CapB